MKRVLSFVLAIFMLKGIITLPVAFSAMSDFKETHWAHKDVMSLVEMGVINGYEDGTFRPDNNITHAEMAKIITIAFDLQGNDESNNETENETTAYGLKRDIKNYSPNEWWSEFALIAVDYYYPGGLSSAYNSADEVSRRQVAVVLVNILNPEYGFDYTTTGYTFPANWKEILRSEFLDFAEEDGWEDDFYIDSGDGFEVNSPKHIYLAKTMGLISGYPDGTFRPNDKITRAEFCAMVNRALDYKYIMNAKGNSGAVFYSNGVYYFSDPRGLGEYREEDGILRYELTNVLNNYYKTDKTFQSFEKAKHKFNRDNVRYKDFHSYDALQIGDYAYILTGRSPNKNISRVPFDEYKKGNPPFSSGWKVWWAEDTEIILTENEIYTMNEYRGLLYYSTGSELFTYDIATNHRASDPLISLESYGLEDRHIANIDICGEKLFLCLSCFEPGYFTNSASATYIANLDGSDLREVIIPQCKDTFQTFNYARQGFKFSAPSYWHICTDEGSYYGGSLMVISPKYDFFMVAGKSEDGYIKGGDLTPDPSKKIENGEIKTKQGLNGEYTIRKEKEIDKMGEEKVDVKDFFVYVFSVSKGDRIYYYSVRSDSYDIIEQLKPTLIEIAENFEIL